MHILPHISLFLLALVLSRSASFMLSWCSLLNVSNDHSVIATKHPIRTLDPLLSTFPIHFDYTLYQLWILCIVQYLVVQCGCPLLHCLSLSGREAELPLSFSLSFSLFLSLSWLLLSFYLSLSSVSALCLASLCLRLFSSSFSSLCFSTILSLLSSPGMQVTYEFSLSMHLSLIHSQPTFDRCGIGYNLPLYLFFLWGHK